MSHLDIELTERCNNDCIHCSINRPEGDRKARERELKTEEWQEVLRQAAALGVLTVRFTGGEPLLREDFEELYIWTRRLGVRVQICTNGRLITPRLADLWARIPPLEKIEITVYGMHAGSYEAVTRKPGSWPEFRRGLDLLVERRIPLLVRGALLPPNRGEREAFENWARTLPGMAGPPAWTLLFDLRGRRDSAARNRKILELRNDPETALRVWKRRGSDYREEMKEFCRKFLEAPGDLLFTCGAGCSISVDAYGRVQPCLLLRDPRLGVEVGGALRLRGAALEGTTEDGDQRSEVRDQRSEDAGASMSLPPASSLQPLAGSLRAALTEFFPGLREVRAKNPEYLRRCARCSLRGLCEQCPAKSWSEHGTLDTPVEYLCEVAHAQARDLGILPAGRKGWE